MSKLKCCGCKSRFDATTMLNFNGSNFHSYDCATEYAKKKSSKDAKAKVKQDKQDHSAAKRRLRETDKKWMMNKTKTICHKYIRLRDYRDACMSCGRYENEIDTTGWDHIWDAGHYLSRGSHPELRFEELNIHKQCVKCNTAPNLQGQERTVREGYRKELIIKIGIDKVEWLEGPHDPKRYTIANLKTIQKWFKRKTRRLEGC